MSSEKLKWYKNVEILLKLQQQQKIKQQKKKYQKNFNNVCIMHQKDKNEISSSIWTNRRWHNQLSQTYDGQEVTSDETYRGQEVGVLQHMQHDDVAGGLVGRDHSPHLYLHVILPKVLPHHLVLPQQLTQHAQTLACNLPLYATNKINISPRNISSP